MENLTVIEKIHSLADVNALSVEELCVLSAEIRREIISTVTQNGGHLASALGAVEAIVALCRVYDFTKDKLIFDVGHQAYAFKILNEGKSRFQTLRLSGGLSGFPGEGVSENDIFSGGHAGNSLSNAMGYMFARDYFKRDENVVVLVGDASFFNGENLEAIFATQKKPERFLVVFNDNGMGISKNENGAYKFFSSLTLKKGYKRAKDFFRKLFGNRLIGRYLRRVKSDFKHSVSPATVLDEVGFKYLGVFDGHDIKCLVKILTEIKNRGDSVFLHIRTQKGKGFEPATADPENYHGVGKNLCFSANEFSENISELMMDEVAKDERVTAITAGMKSGTGLSEFAKACPQNFVDAGICEEYAVTMAAGMARGGLKPVVFIYSTFLQRAYDQIMTDVCVSDLPVVFMLDRAGFVGADGKSHQGLFDLSYLKNIPNLLIFAPKNAFELKKMLDYALKKGGPVAIRYPNGVNEELKSDAIVDDVCEWEVIKDGNLAAIFAVGPRMISLALKARDLCGKSVAVINACSVKPLDEKTMNKYAAVPVITLEENVLSGGFGEGVAAYYSLNKLNVKMGLFGVADNFVPHGTVDYQLELSGLTPENVSAKIKELCEK